VGRKGDDPLVFSGKKKGVTLLHLYLRRKSREGRASRPSGKRRERGILYRTHLRRGKKPSLRIAEGKKNGKKLLAARVSSKRRKKREKRGEKRLCLLVSIWKIKRTTVCLLA